MIHSNFYYDDQGDGGYAKGIPLGQPPGNSSHETPLHPGGQQERGPGRTDEADKAVVGKPGA